MTPQKYAKSFKAIYQPTSMLGGCCYRITSNGKICNIQRMSNRSNSYKTMNTMTMAAWNDAFDFFELDQNDNPAIIEQMIIEDYQIGGTWRPKE